MANIWGMDDVLGDRSIQLILEKSNNPLKTKKMETFEFDEKMEKVQNNLKQCSLCSVVMSGNTQNITKKWNFYINSKYKTTLTTPNTYTTYTTLTTSNHTKEELDNIFLDNFFLKIDKTGLDGRTLELFYPLFLTAKFIGEEVLDSILKFAGEIGEERKSNDIENKDVLLYKFTSEIEQGFGWENIKQLVKDFKVFLGEDDEEWVNSRWLGRAMKRLNLIVSKRRTASGVQIIPNVVKAIEQSKIFNRTKPDK